MRCCYQPGRPSKLGASTDLLVIGAYQSGLGFMSRHGARKTVKSLQVPLPSRDSIGGVCGGLNEHWPHA